MSRPVLLLGNGINNVDEQCSWDDLIRDLVRFARLTRLASKDKPFPLFYEEIYLSNLKANRVPEGKLKKFISEWVEGNINRSVLHERIMSTGFTDIITTNYDYTLENPSGPKDLKLKNKGIIKENLYSLFRHTEVNSTRIWHIHGEVNSPQTILLGFEHYSGQLQRIRNYVVTGTDDSYTLPIFPLIAKPPLAKARSKVKVKPAAKGKPDAESRLGSVGNDSWLDLMFTRDIHIVGLTLDFVESDLWWVITFRARMKLEKKLNIRNSIFYYYPSSYEHDIKPKLGLLSANEIECVPVDQSPHKSAFYFTILDTIKA
jgi:hypothetical protein